MVPLAFNLGPTELLIILAIVLLLFGGSRLAGLGKSTGRALKEFKEETKGLGGKKDADPDASTDLPPQVQNPAMESWQQPTSGTVADPSRSTETRRDV